MAKMFLRGPCHGSSFKVVPQFVKLVYNSNFTMVYSRYIMTNLYLLWLINQFFTMGAPACRDVMGFCSCVDSEREVDIS